MTIDNNAAQKNGGGAALDSSTLNIHKGTVTFHNNTANQDGGAMYLEQRSILYTYMISSKVVPPDQKYYFPAAIVVTSNSAQYGGGVLVDDYTSGHKLCEHVPKYFSFNNSRMLPARSIAI